MVCKIVSLFVCAAVLVQTFEAATVSKTQELSAADRRRAAQIQITRILMNELEKMARIKMENSKNLAENVLNDPKVIEAKSDTMESYLTDFRQFIKHWKDYGDQRFFNSNGVGVIMTEQSALFKKYTNNTETKEAAIISTALKEHGVEEQQQLLHEPLMEYSNKIIPEIENYVRVLDQTKMYDEEKAAFKELIKKIESETDATKRGQLINNYVQTFNIGPDDL